MHVISDFIAFQMEILSGQGSLAMLPNTMDRSKDQAQYNGPPTPMSSTELRAQQSTDFVSPMILHSNNAAMASLAQNPQLLQNFIPQNMIPSAPHSAPANIVFQQQSNLPLPSPAELDFGDFSPLTSPWLGAYGGSQGAPGGSRSGQSVPPSSKNKRRPVSSSGDESSSVAQPARKRQSPTVKAPSAGPPPPKKASTRSTRSANSTPLFQATTRPSPGARRPDAGVGAGDAPTDTPSPIEIPMPPPAHPPPAPPASSIITMQQPPSGAPSPVAAIPPQNNIVPVTPASIMKLGRLGAGAGTSSQGPAPAESTTRSRAASRGESSKASKNLSLVSPGLKPIRPAGSANALSPTSPMAPFPQPMAFRKSSHKAAEQKRRDSLKTSFDDLRVLLPPIPLPSEDGYPDEPLLPGAMPPRGPPKGNAEGPNRGVSKLQLLRCGNEYIKVLKARVDRRDEEIERLRREVARLRVLVPEEERASDVDLERELDVCETAGGALFAKAQAAYAAMGGEGEEADEEGGD
ncbi:hypothetical protein OBBRIDRAFT_797842 [Obba rivulosa]|uniref:BHLH domain-containing protein n=1 Tax=Obba rivulosa TaxID=1052685 RepID=A0A8E2AJK8_9APHY|nr:hypothetical protein OBBRIDRAFT_797842 [Obba rivulosa]